MKKATFEHNAKISREIFEAFNFLGIEAERAGSMRIKVNGLDNLHRLVEATIAQETFKTGNVSTNESFTIHTLGFLNAKIQLTDISGQTETKIIPLNKIMAWIK